MKRLFCLSGIVIGVEYGNDYSLLMKAKPLLVARLWGNYLCCYRFAKTRARHVHFVRNVLILHGDWETRCILFSTKGPGRDGTRRITNQSNATVRVSKASLTFFDGEQQLRLEGISDREKEISSSRRVSPRSMARPILALPTLVSSYLSRLSSVSCRQPSLVSVFNLIFVQGCNGTVPATMTARFVKTWPISPDAVCSIAARLSSVNTSSPLGKAAVFSNAGGFYRPRTWRNRNLSHLRASSSRSMCTAVQVENGGNVADIADGHLPPSPTSGIESLVESEERGETEASVSRSASSKKSKRICYYHSQGLCTMMEDPVHLEKLSHEFEDVSVGGEDLKRLKEQPFDYFLVLDLEGLVEILEFPVVMVDAKTSQVIDHFHRFVRPAKMTEERVGDYIHNKYGRWGLSRVWHDTAIPFTDVLPAFEKWMEGHCLWDTHSNPEKLKTAAFVTCGNWDIKTKIPEQCITSEIDLPVYFNEWINLKDIYYNFYKFRASGMLKMIKGLQMPLLGTHHVGLDDALNIARILQRMLAHGAKMQLTATRKAGDTKTVKFTFKFRIK